MTSEERGGFLSPLLHIHGRLGKSFCLVFLPPGNILPTHRCFLRPCQPEGPAQLDLRQTTCSPHGLHPHDQETPFSLVLPSLLSCFGSPMGPHTLRTSGCVVSTQPSGSHPHASYNLSLYTDVTHSCGRLCIVSVEWPLLCSTAPYRQTLRSDTQIYRHFII